MRRIIIPTMMWKRPEVFQFWCDHFNSIRNDVNAELILLAVGSEGNASKELCQKNGVIYHEFPNMPLGAKANWRLRKASELDWDYVLFLGSDDIVCANYINHCLETIEDYDVIEVKDLYYFDTRSKHFVYCEGYTNHRKGEPLAVGRFAKRELFENRIGWCPWHSRKQKGIDSSFNKSLSKQKRNVISVKDRFLVMDIKTDDNISTFDTTRDNWHFTSRSFIRRKLGERFKDLFKI